MGPGHGITASAGRMIVPVWLATHRKHRPSVSATIYSDDRGKTWQAGEIIVANNDRTVNPSEHMLVELADGRIMSNGRSESKQHRRLTSVSADGATRWSEPRFVDDLYEPICMAGFAAAKLESDPANQLLLLTHPDSGPTAPGYSQEWGDRARRNLTLRLSRDQGDTWDDGLVIESGPSAYSDIAVGSDGFVYVLYETGSGKTHGAFDPQGIVVAKIPLAAIKDHAAP
jgi:sialidase-1